MFRQLHPHPAQVKIEGEKYEVEAAPVPDRSQGLLFDLTTSDCGSDGVEIGKQHGDTPIAVTMRAQHTIEI